MRHSGLNRFSRLALGPVTFLGAAPVPVIRYITELGNIGEGLHEKRAVVVVGAVIELEESSEPF